MKLTKDRLKSLIGQEITNSLGFYGGELSSQRKNALKFYLGEPLGNEVEGQSEEGSEQLEVRRRGEGAPHHARQADGCHQDQAAQ